MHPLGEDHLPYLFRALHDLAASWHGFSLQLGVTGQGQIQQNGRSADDCLALALYQWLKSGDASWTALIAAIYRPAGGGNQVLAQKIADSYKGMELIICHHVMYLGCMSQARRLVYMIVVFSKTGNHASVVTTPEFIFIALQICTSFSQVDFPQNLMSALKGFVSGCLIHSHPIIMQEVLIHHEC